MSLTAVFLMSRVVVRAEHVVLKNRSFNLPKSKQGKGFYLPILDKSVGQIDAMLTYHCKLLIFRLDFHVFETSENSELISSFIHRLRSWLNRKGHKRLGYIWCREQDKSHLPHYHCVFIVDGNKNRHPLRLIQQIEHYWQGWEYGSVYTPKNCYYLLKRGDDARYQDVFLRVSYLAKVATKGNGSNTANDYSTSRIKPKI
ncbi:YagK/YfjJ domain-containing protein [Neptuniibacter marinus]|jgi:hypothetical protein|uniref:YagK/YfjJ domain-containing protein n=1 Tax=Neptuniibacter marinus TaxID=1806670 RepID=UPI00082E4EDF|nr:inovirus-type Gp2 protein [Neptuniibacter marinus]